MKLRRDLHPYGYYANIWEWLDTHIGKEGVDYTTINEPSEPDRDRWIVAEIRFTNPAHETLAQLRWS